jgi:hypothetical protein
MDKKAVLLLYGMSEIKMGFGIGLGLLIYSSAHTACDILASHLRIMHYIFSPKLVFGQREPMTIT